MKIKYTSIISKSQRHGINIFILREGLFSIEYPSDKKDTKQEKKIQT
jgi:hypothetical protein